MFFKKGLFLLLVCTCNLVQVFSQNRELKVREHVPLDSIRLSDPFILADKKTSAYYMTGTGGLLWKSKDLEKWTGPFVVAKTDPGSWMGKNPMIWAAELHQYKGKVM
jgi:beta-xylosidase